MDSGILNYAVSYRFPCKSPGHLSYLPSWNNSFSTIYWETFDGKNDENLTPTLIVSSARQNPPWAVLMRILQTRNPEFSLCPIPIPCLLHCEPWSEKYFIGNGDSGLYIWGKNLALVNFTQGLLCGRTFRACSPSAWGKFASAPQFKAKSSLVLIPPEPHPHDSLVLMEQEVIGKYHVFT